jgi:hypothetical protein
MRTRTVQLAKALALVSALTLLTAGCGRTVTRTRIVHPNGAQVVVVQKGHVHSTRCGHYRHGNTWYLVKGHAHGARCGHVRVKGVWVIR